MKDTTDKSEQFTASDCSALPQWWTQQCECGRRFGNEEEAQLHLIVRHGCGAAMIANKAKQRISNKP